MPPTTAVPTNVIESLMEQARIQQGVDDASPYEQQLFEEFVGAVRHANEPRPGAVEFPEATQRQLYGLFVIAQKGPPPRMPPPGIGEEQHQAWLMTYASYGAEGIKKMDAMREYIELVEATDPSFLFDEDDEDETAAKNAPQALEGDTTLPAALPEAPTTGSSSVFDAIRYGQVLTPYLPTHANAIDEDGLSVLHIAVDSENERAVESLLAAKAQPDAIDTQRATALHYAALLGSSSLVKLLLGAGADPAAADEDGKTPGTLAQLEGHTDVAKTLLAALAAPALAEGLLPGRLPTVDLAAWLHGDAATRETLALAFDQAFQQWGFCNVRGYEELLPEKVIAEAREQAMAFFALPLEEKRRLARVDGVVGYLEAGDETVSDSAVGNTVAADAQGDTGAGAGAQDAQEGNPAKKAADPVESLNLPAYQEEGASWTSANARAECPWRAASYLPSTPAEFGASAVAYFDGATKLMSELMKLMEAALNLPPHHMHVPFERPGTLLRFAYYPPTPPAAYGAGGAAPPSLRYGEHTDYDGFTILQRHGDDGVSGGLEIEMPDGTWAAVPSLPGHLTINIGDLFARWTNDRWRATRHRVTVPKSGAGSAATGTGRLSVVYFTGPHPETIVSCLPSSKCRRQPPQYAPIKAGEHVQMKMLAATAAAREAGTLI